MSSNKKDKAAKVKELALSGQFDEVQSLYGESSAAKAKEYVVGKLNSLRAAIEKGDDITGDKSATPFVLFGLKEDAGEDISILAKRYIESKCTSNESDDDLNSSDDDHPTVTTAPEGMPTVETETKVDAEQIHDEDMDEAMETTELDDLPIEKFKSNKTKEKIDPPKIIKKGGFKMPVVITLSQKLNDDDDDDNVHGDDTTDLMTQPSSQHSSKQITAKKTTKSISSKVDMKNSKKSSSSTDSNKGKGKGKNTDRKLTSTSTATTAATKKHVPSDVKVKSPRSAFILFGISVRKELEAASSDLSENGILQEIGSRWEGLNKEDMNRWSEEAHLDTIRYEEEIANQNLKKKSVSAIKSIENKSAKSVKKVKLPSNEEEDVEGVENQDQGDDNGVDEGNDENETENTTDIKKKKGTTSTSTPCVTTPSISSMSKSKHATSRMKEQTTLSVERKRSSSSSLSSSKYSKHRNDDNKKKKKKRDPNAPKMAKNSYMMFAEVQRKEIMNKHPNKIMKEVLRTIGEKWRELDSSDKREFEEMAATDKKRYITEMKDYRVLHPEDSNNDDEDDDDDIYPKKKKSKPSSLSSSSSSSSSNNKRHRDRDHRHMKTKKTVKKRRNLSARRSQDNTSTSHRHQSSSSSHSKLLPKKTLGIPGRGFAVHSKSGSVSLLAQGNRHGKIPPPKGIKQCHLCPQLDLLHTKTVPRLRTSLPSDIIYKMGTAVVVILAPYRDFVSMLPLGLLSTQDMEDIQCICGCTEGILQGVITDSTDVTIAAQDSTENAGTGSGSMKIITISCKRNGTSTTTTSSMYCLLSVAMSSPLLQSDTYLVTKEKYEASLRAPWLHVGAQIRRLFAAEPSDASSFDADVEDPSVAVSGSMSTLGEWYEGNIYYTRKDAKTNPYRSILVTWLVQEQGTFDWLYAYSQTDSECSPWDLEVSSFVLAENMRPPVYPKSLRVGTLAPESILNYLKSLDFVYTFQMITTEIDEFISMFPDKKDHLDLPTITKLCSKGRYEGARGVGILTLFDDLQRMVNNSKTFNQCNIHFQPWRLADMLDKELLTLREMLASYHSMTGLLERVEHVLEEEMTQGEELSQEL
eukprot:gene8726-18039_t